MRADCTQFRAFRPVASDASLDDQPDWSLANKEFNKTATNLLLASGLRDIVKKNTNYPAHLLTTLEHHITLTNLDGQLALASSRSTRRMTPRFPSSEGN